MKFNNENAKEQMAYVAPKSRLIYVKIEGMICTSLDQDYSGEDIDGQNDWSGNGGWNLQ